MRNTINIVFWGTDENSTVENPTFSELNSLTGSVSLTLPCYDVRPRIAQESEKREYVDKKVFATNKILMGYDIKSEPQENLYVGINKTVSEAFPMNNIVKKDYKFMYSEDIGIGFTSTLTALAVNVLEYNNIDFNEYYSEELKVEKREYE